MFWMVLWVVLAVLLVGIGIGYWLGWRQCEEAQRSQPQALRRLPPPYSRQYSTAQTASRVRQPKRRGGRVHDIPRNPGEPRM